MDVLRSFLTVAILLVVCLFSNAIIAATVDQSHLPYTTIACSDSDPDVCIDSTPRIWIPIYLNEGIFQTFTSGSDGILSGLDIFISNVMTSYPNGAFDVEIWKMSGSLSNAAPNTSYGDVFLFSKEVNQEEWSSEVLGSYTLSKAHIDFTGFDLNMSSGDYYSFVLSRNIDSIPTPTLPMSQNRTFISGLGYRDFDFYKDGIAGRLDGSMLNGDVYFNTYVVSSVPVPASVWLFISGFLGLISIVTHKKTV